MTVPLYGGAAGATFWPILRRRARLSRYWGSLRAVPADGTFGAYWQSRSCQHRWLSCVLAVEELPTPLTLPFKIQISLRASGMEESEIWWGRKASRRFSRYTSRRTYTGRSRLLGCYDRGRSEGCRGKSGSARVPAVKPLEDVAVLGVLATDGSLGLYLALVNQGRMGVCASFGRFVRYQNLPVSSLYRRRERYAAYFRDVEGPDAAALNCTFVFQQCHHDRNQS